MKLLASRASQTSEHESFVGGLPKLPRGEGIPRCRLCGADESFFFQVACPEGSPWHRLSLAVFACTSCADENHLIPQMLSGPLKDADIPEGFLQSYQRNFRFMVFETASATLRQEYRERVVFRPFHLEKVIDPDVDANKLGGTPNWLLDDESPRFYFGNAPMSFFLQLLQGFRFEINRGAPPQVELGLDGSPQPSTSSYYQLFNGNKVFLFATEDRAKPLIYAITQID
ncbi:MAG TPA: hypothetical protein VM008_18145 [Phycisphaerae bacterium]|nr:hypothetical protein [Phycisphaerae bacterium]